MQQILAGLIGVICLMDDCLVYGLNQAEHDDRLVRVCQLVEAGVTLNPEKCVFSVDSVTFLGHIIDASGIRSDPVQRFRIALARYYFTIRHIPGSRMYLPDTLFRAPLSNSDCAAAELTVEADAYLDDVSLIFQLRRGNSKKSSTRRLPIRIATSSPLLRGRDGQRRIPFKEKLQTYVTKFWR